MQDFIQDVKQHRVFTAGEGLPMIMLEHTLVMFNTGSIKIMVAVTLVEDKLTVRRL